MPDPRPTPGGSDEADAALLAALRDYAARWPREAPTVEGFIDLLDDGAHAFQRERLAGHLTASAWLVDRGGTRVLLTHHRKLGLWLQLGGHADGDRDLPRVALKEAEEESGLTGLALDGDALFDVDRHWIPARADVPGHWHYDVRYVVRAGDCEAYAVSEESLDLAWRDIAELVGEAGADASVRRMAMKWLERSA